MSDDIEERMRTLAVKPSTLSDDVRAALPDERSPVDKARVRLELAALAIGDCHLAGIDPGWSESNEVEQASILYTQAVRAEQEGT